MALVFRTEDLLRWGAGKGANLNELEFDENIWDLHTRIESLENITAFAVVSIDDFSVDGDQLTIIMTDYTTRGPFTLPVVLPHPRGPWAAATAYVVFDLVTVNGAVYAVAVAHTSDATFDAGKQIGGVDVYGLLFEAPQNSLPAGGALGMFLAKSSATDYEVAWVQPPVPTGGTTGQKLVKASNTDNDTEWVDSTIVALDDVAVVGLANGHVLIYDASAELFNNGPMLTTYVGDINQGARAHGHILRYNATNDEWTSAFSAPPQIYTLTTLTLDETYFDKLLRFNNAGGCAITVPPDSGFTAGTLSDDGGEQFQLRQSGSGALTIIPGSGVLVNGIEGFSYSTNRRGAVLTLERVGTNEWDLWGLLAPEIPS